ncbi:ATP-dependent helicase [Angustibacter sp. Root456]|nr:ATP-dependent DNA helicase [Angustibacter sp. Root456]KQX63633.1 ATP-dependent helicase [Angustibacter sp. Root456]
MPSQTSTRLHELLRAAVSGIGGVERPGQVQMAEAVQHAVESGEHLLVQAGTGTGKSVAYLVPALAHSQHTRKPVVVATATLALQAQVVDRDLPRVVESLAPLLGRRPTYGLVKGRRNYLCKHKLVGGFPDDEDDALFGSGSMSGGTSASALGEQVLRLREWADETDSGDRDELVPGVSERAWRQVSVSAQECLGGKCPLVDECFVEQARAAAKDADVVVTNHSMLAIDAFEGRQILPEHDLVVIDEAHELVDRVTSTITDELTAPMVERAARKAHRLADVGELADAALALRGALELMAPGRLVTVPHQLGAAVSLVRDAARTVQSELKPEKGAEVDAGRQVARAEVDAVFEVAERLLSQNEYDVAWVSDDPRRGPVVHVAPIGVAGLLREKLYADRTIVMTSATLELGGTFDAVARSVGLSGPDSPAWQGLDVGSPFDYGKQAILYCAKHLPPPGRDGTSDATMDELADLIQAAGGRTLGLFSSRRAAEAAAEAMRERLDLPVLCQGDDQMPTLVRQFARDARTCLFGTLSLWQGVDVPGHACHLVVIDRIPFPRPDDPLMSARSQAVADAGGNGFMAVAATYAALRMAQGAGRLVRSSDDRGVVAVLDPRLATARYGSFLRASLPPFWPTADKAKVLAALQRLDESAGELRAVHDPGSRAEAMRDKGSAPVPVQPGPSAEPAPVPDSARTAVVLGRAWTPEDDTLLREGVDLGCTLDDLADQFECEPDVVQARLDDLGLTAATDELF